MSPDIPSHLSDCLRLIHDARDMLLRSRGTRLICLHGAMAGTGPISCSHFQTTWFESAKSEGCLFARPFWWVPRPVCSSLVNVRATAWLGFRQPRHPQGMQIARGQCPRAKHVQIQVLTALCEAAIKKRSGSWSLALDEATWPQPLHGSSRNLFSQWTENLAGLPRPN